MIETSALNDTYRRTLGFPSRSAEYFAGGRRVEVFKWEPSSRTSDVFLYVTSGLVLHEFAEHKNHRGELFVGLLPAEDYVARGLAAAAFELMRRDVAPQHGMTVTFAEALWAGTSFIGFVIALSLDDVIPTTQIDDLHVQFYQAIPITLSEAEYIRANGYEKLRTMWQTANVAFWDPARESSL